MEISADTQCATIGELVAYQFMWYEPTYQDTGKETYNRQEYLSCHKIEDVKQRLFEEMQCGTSGAQREGTDDTHDTARDRDDDSRSLTGDVKFLMEEGGTHLV